jgi:hypothetical protein
MKKVILLIFSVGFLLVATDLNAQPGTPTDGNPTPITGIEILIALGGLFGVKKIIDNRRKNKHP